MSLWLYLTVIYVAFLFLFLFIYVFWLRQSKLRHVGSLVAARMRDLVPRPGMEPRPPALGAQSLSHWTIREVPPLHFFKENKSNVLE